LISWKGALLKLISIISSAIFYHERELRRLLIWLLFWMKLVVAACGEVG